MRRRPATLVFAAVLVSLAACASPTAPTPAKRVTAPVSRDVVPSDTPTDTTARSGYNSTGG